MTRLRMLCVVTSVAAVLACVSAASAATLTYDYFLTQLIDLDGLPKMEPGVRCKQASSYDRASHDPAREDANGDSGKYLRTEPDGEAVMAEIEGPGCIYRIWSANPQGKIRFYLDGDARSTYEFDFDEMFRGNWGVQQVPRPIVYKRGDRQSASDSYLPIPFARSCKVTADRAHGQYYHIQYKVYPPGTQVETFHLPLSAECNALLQRVAGAWAAMGDNPQPPGPAARTVTRELVLRPPLPVSIARLDGPGVVKSFRVKLESDERHALRKTMLRIYFDGSPSPDVNAPVGDFFGGPWGEVDYRSLPLGMSADGGYCYFRMPFRRQARLALANQGQQPVKVRFEITWEPAAHSTALRVNLLPPDVGYFHAKWRREAPCERFNYPFLQASGQGRYVGVMMGIEHPTPGWWGEGDEKVRVDDDDFPAIWGTGSEDFFGDAWGIRADLREPLFGCNLDVGSRTVCYRFQVPDSIPFERSFDMAIENYPPWDDDYCSVAYWYATRPGEDFFSEYTVSQRMPWGRALANALEAEGFFASALPSGARIATDTGLPWDLSRHAGIEITAGAAKTLGPAGLEVPAAGAYYVLVYGEPGRVMPGLAVDVGGAALTPRYSDADKGLTAFGPAALQAGQQALVIRTAPDTAGILDALSLQPTYDAHTLEAEWTPIAGHERGDHGVQEMGYAGERSGVGAQVLFTGRAEGATISFPFEVAADGEYAITSWLSTSLDYGIYQMAVDGNKIGEPFDAWSPDWIVAGKRVAATARLTPGPHRLDFVAVGRNPESKGYFLGIDAFAVEPAD